MPRIDARRLILLFHGPAALRRRLLRDGYPLNIKTLERWAARGRIPADWLLILSAYAEKDGRQLRLHDFIVSTEDRERLRLHDRDYLD